MNTPTDDTALWDVALEALLADEYQSQGEALGQAVLTRLADQHNIRLDDILDTLCKLTAHGAWQFTDKDGAVLEPDPDMCRLLRANHRLNDIQLDRLRGRWRPAA